MKGLTTFLWYDGRALEAARFYVGIFPNSRILGDENYPDVDFPEGAEAEAGSVMTVAFELDGMPFIALNGGPQYSFTPAISFQIACETQDEVDYFWDRLIDGGGEPGRCGWLTDRFGVSWQVVPTLLGELAAGPDGEAAARMWQALLAMDKLVIADLQRAYDATA